MAHSVNSQMLITILWGRYLLGATKNGLPDGAYYRLPESWSDKPTIAEIKTQMFLNTAKTSFFFEGTLIQPHVNLAPPIPEISLCLRTSSEGNCYENATQRGKKQLSENAGSCHLYN